MASRSNQSAGAAESSRRRLSHPLCTLFGAAAATLTSVCLMLAGSAAAATPPYGLGLIPTPAPQAGANGLRTSNLAGASLPASVSMTQHAIAVGNQGQLGSCAAWSTDYSALGYWENKEGISGGGLEPMYSYSQVNGGVDDGSSIEANLWIDETQGIDTQSDYWQGNFDYSDQPTAAEKLNAVNWKLSGYSNLTINGSASQTVTQTSIETALAAGDPVVIGIPVYSNFYYVGTANAGYYAGPSGAFEGDHAVTALGYNSQGLVIENSWGTGWGNAGFATLSWAFINGYVMDAVSVGPLVASQPVESAVPSVSGTVRVRQVLTAQPGSWSTTVSSYAYQWESATPGSNEWATISGAASASYLVPSSLQGDDLRVIVTATNQSGSGAAASTPTAAVGAALAVPVATVGPSISGVTAVGATLSVTAGSWTLSPTSYAYQWQRSSNNGGSWVNIPGATSSSYTLTASDAGDQERAVVTATNAVGAGTADSTAVGPVLSVPVSVTAPSVSGIARVGQALSVGSGSWNPAATSYSYQWQRSSNSGASWGNISGSASATYVAQSADVNAELRAQVCATNGAGSSCVTTAPTGLVTAASISASAPPVVSGTPARGDQLSATGGSWAPTPTSYVYQWQRSTNNGGTWASISGAISPTYTPVRADEGSQLRVTVTVGNGSLSATADSSATSAVRANAPALTVLPKVSGIAAAGDKLTVGPGTWAGFGNTYSYQWQRGSGNAWTTIAGSTTSTYTVGKADAGYSLRVLVRATNADGSASAASAATAKVAMPAAKLAAKPAVKPTAKPSTRRQRSARRKR
jgi:hypothetical protein